MFIEFGPPTMIAERAPDPLLRFDPEALALEETDRAYFRRRTIRVARDLLGAWLARRWRGRWHGARIVETEAYLGPRDRAAHSWAGRRTPRVAPMYADGGHLYVYFVYGMHFCANVVTRREGIPEAVLLRAAAGPAGAPERLLSGPAKLCAAFGLTTRESGRDLLDGGSLRIFRRRGRGPSISVTPRIGVGYAGDAAAWRLRFFDRDSAAVSKR
jgi:DNA-3-methyladenine glycosylase